MDLTTTFLGYRLAHPLVALIESDLDVGNLLACEEDGAAAILVPFMHDANTPLEDVARAQVFDLGVDAHPEAADYFPFASLTEELFVNSLDAIHAASTRAGIPIFVSLRGAEEGIMLQTAMELEEAGASAIELDLQHPLTQPEESGPTMERRMLELVRRIVGRVRIPVAVRMHAHFTSPSYLALQLAQAGASGMVLGERYSGVDIDLASLVPVSVCQTAEARDPGFNLAWLASLHARSGTSLAVVERSFNSAMLIKYLLAGANAVAVPWASEQRRGGYLKKTLGELENWMGGQNVQSLARIRGALSHVLANEAS